MSVLSAERRPSQVCGQTTGSSQVKVSFTIRTCPFCFVLGNKAQAGRRHELQPNFTLFFLTPHRAAAESLIQYNYYIDNMPTSDVPGLGELLAGLFWAAALRNRLCVDKFNMETFGLFCTQNRDFPGFFLQTMFNTNAFWTRL